MFASGIFRISRMKAALIVGAVAAVLGTMLSTLLVRGAVEKVRPDGAQELAIETEGSLQNAAFSPSGAQIAFTRFRGGYNKSPADILIFDLQSKALRALIDDGYANISSPGSSWNRRAGRIVFSSTRSDTDHDEIFSIAPRAGSEAKQLTSDDNYMSYEPSMSPDGRSVVFESHPVNEQSNGRIRLLKSGVAQPEDLTGAEEDCRQPNWSPGGDVIVYQKKEGDQWDLWIYDIARQQHRRLTQGDGDKTDATFSPDGRWVLYSADNSDLKHASLFAMSLDGARVLQVTDGGAYDGAASWSPDGKTIVFESASARRVSLRWRLKTLFQSETSTRLWRINAPDALYRQLCLGPDGCR